MRWQEQTETPAGEFSGQVIDIAFQISCHSLPVDHAYLLSQAITGILPWLDDEELAGIHVIYGGASGNGWLRPDSVGDALLQLSKRTKLTLRVPENRFADTAELTGHKLVIAGHDLTVGTCARKQLIVIPALISRYVVLQDVEDENQFIDRIAWQIKHLGIAVTKLVCGKLHQIRTPGKLLPVRSVMVADLRPEDSIRLQQMGVGSHRKLGCGIFNPSKI